LVTIGVDTVRSVTFSKAPLAQLQAHVVVCLTTGEKRRGVYCGATDGKCLILPVIPSVISSFFTEWRFPLVSVFLVIDAHSDVWAHLSTFRLTIIYSTPHPATNSLIWPANMLGFTSAPTWTNFSYLKCSQKFPPKYGKKFLEGRSKLSNSDVTCTANHRLTVTQWVDQDEKDEPLEFTWRGDTCLSCGSESNILLGSWWLMFVSGFLHIQTFRLQVEKW
jgi:hypothetical protein